MKKADIVKTAPDNYAATLELCWFQEKLAGKTYLCQKYINAEDPYNEDLDIWVAVPIQDLEEA